jgi:hypothetical protein
MKNPEPKCWKIYFKKSDCTVCLFKNLTYLNGMQRLSVLKKIYKDWNGTLILKK